MLPLNSVKLELFKHHDLSRFIDEVKCGICLGDLPNKTEEWALHFFSNIDSHADNPEDLIRNRQFHIFHKDCGLRWVEEHLTCASCRESIDEDSLKEIIEKDKKDFLLAAKNGNKETIENLFGEFSIEILEKAIREAIERHQEEVVLFLIQCERAKEFSVNCLLKTFSFLLPNYKQIVDQCLSTFSAETLQAILAKADKDGHEEIKQLLLEKGVTLNHQNNDLASALYLATGNRYEGAIEFFLNAGRANGRSFLYIPSRYLEELQRRE